MKVDKYIGHSGFTSRRKAYELVDAKRVTVNGKVANFSTKITEGDVILIDGVELKKKEFIPTYIVYNKPKGIECTSEKIENNIIDAIGHSQAIYPVVSREPNSKRIFRITLTQGLNRQIRRMCNAFDYQVIKLQRIRVMNIKLDKLKIGEWRDLTQTELDELFAQLN